MFNKILKEHFLALVVKNPPASARDARDTSSMPGLGRSPGEGCGSPVFLPGESHSREAWWATSIVLQRVRND